MYLCICISICSCILYKEVHSFFILFELTNERRSINLGNVTSKGVHRGVLRIILVYQTAYLIPFGLEVWLGGHHL